MILFRNVWKLYEWINKNHRSVIVEMMDALGWSEKKVQRYADRLVELKIVKIEMRHTDKLYYPTPVGELINWNEMNNG